MVICHSFIWDIRTFNQTNLNCFPLAVHDEQDGGQKINKDVSHPSGWMGSCFGVTFQV